MDPTRPSPGFAVLRSPAEIKAARLRLRQLGIDCTSSPLRRRLRRWGLLGGMSVGDTIKSWDVLKTVDLLRETLPRDAPLLDIGAFASEVPCALYRAGFVNLSGVDLDPRVTEMPNADSIRYVVGDFMATPFADASFSAITAISVIEHGFDGVRLLTEVSRLLRPGGLFVASVDYWEAKIDTAGIKAFGLDWRIFSREEILAFFRDAEADGLHATGPANFSCDQRVIHWSDRHYTFGWMSLRKASP